VTGALDRPTTLLLGRFDEHGVFRFVTLGNFVECKISKQDSCVEGSARVRR
jgi:hypothetical protein